LEPRCRQHASDERSLSGGVRGHVLRVVVREAQLQSLVLGRQSAITTQGVSEGKSLAPEVASGLSEMKAIARLEHGLLEVVRDPRAVRSERIGDPSEGLECGASLVELADTRHHGR
jgi:hypothetical protein